MTNAWDHELAHRTGKRDTQAQPSPDRYSGTAMLLHWMVALFLLVLIGLGWYMVGIPRGTPERAYFYNLHKSIGVTAALLIALRILWRITHPPPALPATMPQWQQRAARLTHFLLYVCIIVMPLSGFIASNFTKFGVTYFGVPLPILGWEDRAIYGVFNSIHVFTSYLLVALIALHVLAALKHLAVDHDLVFQRMWPGRRE